MAVLAPSKHLRYEILLLGNQAIPHFRTRGTPGGLVRGAQAGRVVLEVNFVQQGVLYPCK